MNPRNRTKEEWVELVTKQLASGQTQKAWCEANGINLHTMSDRITRLRKEGLFPKGQGGEERVPEKQADWVTVFPSVTDKAVEISISVGNFTIQVPPHFEEAELTRICQVLVGLC